MVYQHRLAAAAKRVHARKNTCSLKLSSLGYALAGTLSIGLTASAFAQETELPMVTVNASRNATLNLDVPSSTGSRLGLTPLEIPASVSSLDNDAIVDRDLTRAQDVAIRLPGITESPAPGNGGTSLTARGFAGDNSVAQLVNGTRLTVASGTISYPFSTWPLDSVEVLSGPASVLYGDGAIGAAVNYVTKKPLFDRTEREAMVGVGSYGARQAGIGLRGPINDVLAYSIYIDTDKSDGYRSDQAHDRQNISAALTVRPNSDLNITFGLDAGHNDDSHYYGTPLINGKLDDRLRHTSFDVDDAIVKYNDKMWHADVEYKLNDDVTLHNETYYLTSNRHWRNTESYAFNPATGLVDRTDYLEILHNEEQTGNRFDATIDGHIAGLKNRFVTGFEWSRTRYLNTNNSPFDGSSSVNPFDVNPGVFASPDPTVPGRRSVLETKAVFAENVLDIAPGWKLVTGLRHEQMDLDADNLRTDVDLSKHYAPTTGRIGAIWAVSNTLSLYGQYSTGTDPLSGALSLPNVDNKLDLTTGRQLEVGAKGNLPAINGQWTVTLYRIEKRNLVSADPANPDNALQVGKQSSTGIELAFAAEPIRGWTVDANVALLRARYDNFIEADDDGNTFSRNGNTPVDVPEQTANVWTTYRFLPQWKAALGARYVGKREADTANTTTLPAYTVFDTALTYNYSRSTTVMLAVKNLTNRDYVLSGNGDVNWLLGEPRTALLTVRTTF